MRLALILLALFAFAVLVWWASIPVLLHTHLLTKADYRSCGAYNGEGTGVTILNPCRSRMAERVADAILRSASAGTCSAGTGEALCRFISNKPFLAKEWRLVNRRDIGNEVHLFYKVGPQQECVMTTVHLKQTDAGWKISGYGVSY